jgi:hypothetical protein
MSAAYPGPSNPPLAPSSSPAGAGYISSHAVLAPCEAAVTADVSHFIASSPPPVSDPRPAAGRRLIGA